MLYLRKRDLLEYLAFSHATNILSGHGLLRSSSLSLLTQLNFWEQEIFCTATYFTLFFEQVSGHIYIIFTTRWSVSTELML